MSDLKTIITHPAGSNEPVNSFTEAAVNAIMATRLKRLFPWLGTSDDDDIPYPSGADVIDQLEMYYREVLNARQ